MFESSKPENLNGKKQGECPEKGFNEVLSNLLYFWSLRLKNQMLFFHTSYFESKIMGKNL